MPSTRSRSSAKRVADEAPETNGRSSAKRTKSTENGSANGSAKSSGAAKAKADKKGKKTAKIQGQDSAMTKKSFRKDLFSDDNVDSLREFHEKSGPYQHCVINDVVSTSLLRSVRAEIMENIHFTPKHTDIYTIYQSGDLVNISGLTEAERKLLPSLSQLRDALYSPVFRDYIEKITNCGKLSGSKVDMAINVYTKGCHLLCHDDVIGTRCVSYILYLTDPDDPWQPEWGGGLRLYPTNEVKDDEGKASLIPTPDWSLVIPPASNQLACFVVQPGKSFHDVEEVFIDGKARMAVSGWFHIPEKHEDGYVEGREKELAEKSSMKILEKNLEVHDSPKAARSEYPETTKDTSFSEEDTALLKKYVNPTYLEEKSLTSVAERFSETKNVQLLKILDTKFSDKLKAYIEDLDSAELEYDGAAIPKDTPSWKVSGPSYKQRFLYKQPDQAQFDTAADSDLSPLDELSQVLLPSTAFRKLLAKITTKFAINRDIITRRFRPGLDYTLGLGQDDETPRLEVVLGLTPTIGGWDVPLESEDAMEEEGDDEEEEGEGEDGEDGDDGDEEIIIVADEDEEGDDEEGEDDEEDEDEDMEDDEEQILDNWGGYEVYMSTGDGKTKHPRIDDPKNKNTSTSHELDDSYDPAIVSTAANSGDDGLMLHLPANWNSMNIIYRETGIMRFTKYVSRAAAGSRWDVGGVYEVEADSA
ncbi:hypothetical protein H072_4764 [Dactylellina haptotyla CBS 200.50]|uniref:uS12 prolyl 3,4-dihydroxylase n=1 Tax=Dactylellina haptotyla (strain CBS 200.50) TaxID=1284197 RepID=S8AJQ8_DACHA|nr:hypothetical protein H072_4764 [Dactylellina haptotyla CBS 200.50]